MGFLKSVVNNYLNSRYFVVFSSRRLLLNRMLDSCFFYFSLETRSLQVESFIQFSLVSFCSEINRERERTRKNANYRCKLVSVCMCKVFAHNFYFFYFALWSFFFFFSSKYYLFFSIERFNTFSIIIISLSLFF